MTTHPTPTPETLLAEALRADCEYQWAKAGYSSAFVTALHATNVSQWTCRSDHPMQVADMLAHAPLRDALVRGLGMSGDRCPAASHHRVRSYRSGGMVRFSEDGDIEYAPNTLESDRCTACGFDFALTPEATDAAE